MGTNPTLPVSCSTTARMADFRTPFRRARPIRVPSLCMLGEWGRLYLEKIWAKCRAPGQLRRTLMELRPQSAEPALGLPKLGRPLRKRCSRSRPCVSEQLLRNSPPGATSTWHGKGTLLWQPKPVMIGPISGLRTTDPPRKNASKAQAWAPLAAPTAPRMGHVSGQHFDVSVTGLCKTVRMNGGVGTQGMASCENRRRRHHWATQRNRVLGQGAHPCGPDYQKEAVPKDDERNGRDS